MTARSPEGGGQPGGGAATTDRRVEAVFRTPMHERDIDTTVHHHADHTPTAFLEKQPESAREQLVKTLIDTIRTGEWREQQVGRRRYDKGFRDRAVQSVKDAPEFLNSQGDTIETDQETGRKYVKHDRGAEIKDRLKGVVKKQAKYAVALGAMGLVTGGFSWAALAGSTVTHLGVEAYRMFSGKEAAMRERILLARERINDKAQELANQVPEDKYPDGYNVDAKMAEKRDTGDPNWYESFKHEYDEYAEYQVKRTTAIRELINFVCAVERDAVRFRQDAGGNPYIHSEPEGDIREEMPARGEPTPSYEPSGKVMTRGTDAMRNSENANGDVTLQNMEEEYAKYVAKMDKIENWLSAGAGIAAAAGVFHIIKEGIMGDMLTHGHALHVGGLSVDGHIVSNAPHVVHLTGGAPGVGETAQELGQRLAFDYNNIGEALLSHGHGADVLLGESAGQFGSHVMGETAGKAIDMLNTLALEYAGAELAAIALAQGGLAGLENHQINKKLEHDQKTYQQKIEDNENERRGLLPPYGDLKQLDDAELQKRHMDKLRQECRAFGKPFPAVGDVWVKVYDGEETGSETRIEVLDITPDGHASVEIYQQNPEDNLIKVWPIERIFEQFDRRKGAKPGAQAPGSATTTTTSAGGGAVGGGSSTGGAESGTTPVTTTATENRRHYVDLRPSDEGTWPVYIAGTRSGSATGSPSVPMGPRDETVPPSHERPRTNVSPGSEQSPDQGSDVRHEQDEVIPEPHIYLANEINQVPEAGEIPGRSRPLQYRIAEQPYKDDIVIIPLSRDIITNTLTSQMRPPKLDVNGVPYKATERSAGRYTTYREQFINSPNLDTVYIALRVVQFETEDGTDPSAVHYDMLSPDESREQAEKAGIHIAGTEQTPEDTEQESGSVLFARETGRNASTVRYGSDPFKGGDTIVIPIDRLLQRPHKPSLKERLLRRPLPEPKWRWDNRLNFEVNDAEFEIDSNNAETARIAGEIDQFFDDDSPSHQSRSIGLRLTKKIFASDGAAMDVWRYTLVPLDQVERLVLGNVAKDQQREKHPPTEAPSESEPPERGWSETEVPPDWNGVEYFINEPLRQQMTVQVPWTFPIGRGENEPGWNLPYLDFHTSSGVSSAKPHPDQGQGGLYLRHLAAHQRAHPNVPLEVELLLDLDESGDISVWTYAFLNIAGSIGPESDRAKTRFGRLLGEATALPYRRAVPSHDEAAHGDDQAGRVNLDRTDQHDAAAIWAGHDRIRQAENGERAVQEPGFTGRTRIETGHTGEEAWLEIDSNNPAEKKVNVVYEAVRAGSEFSIPVRLLGKPQEIRGSVPGGSSFSYKQLPKWTLNGVYTRTAYDTMQYNDQASELEALFAMSDEELASEEYTIRIINPKDLVLMQAEYEIVPPNRPPRQIVPEAPPIKPPDGTSTSAQKGETQRPDYAQIFERPDLSGEIAPEFGRTIPPPPPDEAAGISEAVAGVEVPLENQLQVGDQYGVMIENARDFPGMVSGTLVPPNFIISESETAQCDRVASNLLDPEMQGYLRYADKRKNNPDELTDFRYGVEITGKVGSGNRVEGYFYRLMNLNELGERYPGLVAKIRADIAADQAVTGVAATPSVTEAPATEIGPIGQVGPPPERKKIDFE